MIVIDSNTMIKHLAEGSPLPSGPFVVPDDLYDEYQTAELRHGAKIANVIMASTLKGYDEAHYLREYARVINDYSQFSFAKMRGFGDISILALVACLVNDFGRKPPQTSLDLGDRSKSIITVATEDRYLRKRIESEFGDQVTLLNAGDA